MFIVIILYDITRNVHWMFFVEIKTLQQLEEHACKWFIIFNKLKDNCIYWLCHKKTDESIDLQFCSTCIQQSGDSSGSGRDTGIVGTRKPVLPTTAAWMKL